MRYRLRPLLFVLILLAVGLTLFFVFRARGRAASGPPVALCPGPDLFGYTCEPGQALSYVDATNDAELYADDAQVELVMPFPFTFYGRAYTTILASSNGYLQFSSGVDVFDNVCLYPRPAVDMGDMIAPYWDDLDLSFQGYLETEVVGEPPGRIFVVEWDDVPGYGKPDDRVTFEVQLFEGSNDIVFFYEDASRIAGNKGSTATIGLQSESSGFALQYSCNQYALSDGAAIHFPYPQEPGSETVATQPPVQGRPIEVVEAAVKGEMGTVLKTLNQRGTIALPGLRLYWLSRTPERDSDWRVADTDGDDRDEIIYLLQRPRQQPAFTQLDILDQDDDGQWHLQWSMHPLARREYQEPIRLLGSEDVTGDGSADVLIAGEREGRLTVISQAEGPVYRAYSVYGRCTGSLVIRDVDGNGVTDIVRDGCGRRGRLVSSWTGGGFSGRFEQ